MEFRTLRSAAAWLVVVGALGVASSARADVAPPAGFVETCTVEHESGAGQACVLCGDAYYAKPDACAAKLETAGYVKRCRSRGASTWKEVWCRKTTTPVAAATASASAAEPAPAVSAADPVQPPPAAEQSAKGATENAPKHGCGACRVGAPQNQAGLMSLAVALGLLGITLGRRRRS